MSTVGSPFIYPVGRLRFYPPMPVTVRPVLSGCRPCLGTTIRYKWILLLAAGIANNGRNTLDRLQNSDVVG